MSTVEKVQRKETFKSYEAGGGTMYIPILSNIFPKLFNNQSKEILKYFIITSNTKYRVNEAIYNKLKVGDRFNSKDSFYA